jgi:uncharacterized protein (DUF2141 family)
VKKIILIALIVISGMLHAQKINLTVEMTGFKSNDGRVKVGLYNSEGNFLKTPLKSLAVEIKNNKATVTFTGIEKGEYAVSIYHDENNNGQLDTGFMGIPSEGYASSNNAKGFMGPPKYADAKLKITTNATIAITVNN